MAVIERLEDVHGYLVDGVRKTSITDVCAVFGDDGTDEDFDMSDVLERAADRGVTCHAVLEALLKGETDIEYPDAYEDWVEAIRLFLSEHHIVPIAIEQPIYDPVLDLAGTPDLLCYFDGPLTLNDWKFVATVNKPKCKAQDNGYRLCYEHNGVFVEKMNIVQFGRGTYRIYPVAIDDTEFMSAYQIHQIKHKKYGRGVID